MTPSLRLPDSSVCKTRHHFADYWVCLGKGLLHTDFCPYVLRFGQNHYCKHPQRCNFSKFQD